MKNVLFILFLFSFNFSFGAPYAIEEDRIITVEELRARRFQESAKQDSEKNIDEIIAELKKQLGQEEPAKNKQPFEYSGITQMPWSKDRIDPFTYDTKTSTVIAMKSEEENLTKEMFIYGSVILFIIIGAIFIYK